MDRCMAAILDLDGVLTRTAALHARAWKRTFDAFLARRPARAGEDRAPFEIETDYRRHVDGVPRLDGVRRFVASRGISLPEGNPEDGPEVDTVHGLAARKNRLFLELLEQSGVRPFTDALEQLRRWRARGVPVAVITASRNGAAVLDAAGLRDYFDVVIDGVEAARLGLRGKPSPDVFLEAARRLGVDPADTLVVEDAIAGVEAARAGGFGRVAGVFRPRESESAEARAEAEAALRAHGADLVVTDLRELDARVEAGSGAAARRDGGVGAAVAEPAVAEAEATEAPVGRPRPALEHVDEITRQLKGKRLALFLDYDGTLTPIARRPELATLPDGMRERVRALAACAVVAIVSGRDLANVRSLVGLDELYYAGSHGFHIAGPGGVRMEQEAAGSLLAELDDAERRLRRELEGLEGVRIERKRFALAVHFREAAEGMEREVEAIVERTRRMHPGLRMRGGKKIFELQPDVPWDKGRAVLWLLDRLGLAGPDVLPAYSGDDATDEDAFAALAGRGLTVRVGAPEEPTRAVYVLRDVAELERFLRILEARTEGCGGGPG